MACGGRSLVDEASRLLNDAEPGFENIRWTRADLLSYLNEALCMLSIARPNMFLTTMELPLSVGSVQRLPDGVKALYRIDGTVLPDGSISNKAPSKGNQYLARWFTNVACAASAVAAGAAYVVGSYSVDANDKQSFIVQPPVPADKAGVKVSAVVLKAPGGLTEKSDALGVDCCYGPALIEWMLYRAYGVDDESASSPIRAREHLATFFSILQIDAAQQAALMINKPGAMNVSVPAAASSAN